MHVTDNLKRAVFRNASANLVRLMGSGIVALLLPPFLVRMLPKDTYSAWALLLQVSAYVAFLDFGIQTAVSRFVAHATELEDTDQRDGIVSTAAGLLVLAALLGLCLVSVAVWQLPHVFTGMPLGLHRQAQWALLFIAGSFTLGLPLSVISAVFIGLLRNEIPAVIVILNKVVFAVLTIAAVLQHRGLAAMGLAAALANLLSSAGLYFAWKRWASDVRINIAAISRAYARQIVSYSAALGVWFAASLMVSGLDLTIVGIFDYSATAYYAVAATLTNFVVQAQSAVFAALLPASATLAARGDAQKLGSLLVSSTRYGMLMLLGMALPLMLTGRFLLRVWVGSEYALHGNGIMEILVLANVIRLAALPYATLLLGTGQQRKVILSPLAEGFTNLVVSVIGASLYGAIGVAFGTLIGSFVSLGLHLFYNMPRTAGIAVDRSLLVRHSLVRPLLCAAPLAFPVLLRLAKPDWTAGALSLVCCIALVCAAYLFWEYGLVNSERERLGAVLRLS